MFSDDESLFAAMRAGARGYLLKGAEPAEIERAVRGVAGGEAVFGPEVAARVLRHLTTPLPHPPRPFPQLTHRELEVLALLAEGRRPQEISADLGLAPKTVSNITSSILTKLQVSDRLQAALLARNAGLGNTQHLTPD